MILNIAAYQFVPIDEPRALRDVLRERAAAAMLRGTILVAPEGLNLFLAGEPPALRRFLAALRTDARFSGIRVKESWSAEPPFARLKVRCKREIIRFEQAGSSPVEAGTRAPVVDATTLVRWLDRGCDDNGRPVVMLDTRNRQEVAHGTFTGALTLPIERFTQLPQTLAAHRDALRGSTVVAFCTGGIRCEKAVLWMRHDGMDNVLQLDDGILGYFEAVGDRHYGGGCFVFDDRVSLAADLRPLPASPAGSSARTAA